VGHLIWYGCELVAGEHAFLEAMALSDAGWEGRYLVVRENEPAELSWK